MSLLLDALKEAEKSRKGLETAAEPSSSKVDPEVVLDLDLEQPSLEKSSEPKQADAELVKSEKKVIEKQSHNASEITSTANATTSDQKSDITSIPSVTKETPPIPATRPKAENRSRVAANVFQNQEPVSSQLKPQKNSRALILLFLLLLVVIGLVVMFFVLSTEPESTFSQSRHIQSEPIPQALETNSLPEKTATSITPNRVTPSSVDGNQPSLIKPDQTSRKDTASTLTNAVENPQANNRQLNTPAFETPSFNKIIGNQGQESANDSHSSNEPSRTSAPKPGIQITKRKLSPRSQSSLTAAEQALKAGHISNAEAAYRQALKESPNNITAMSSLAGLLAQQGNTQEAQALFLRILEKDPENLIAKTGLINIRATDPSNLSAGSKLKQLLTEHPKQAHLYASLGNFHARRNEWPAAQAAYFEAFALDSQNPDYAFNLAISLDQIGKPDIAINYYEKAVELFGKQPSQFNKADAERRLSELKGLNQQKGTAQ